ncbi:MAG TPA: hypothetical protein VM030_11545 [Acidimicrobiales bacterium]|nr:hypothetical protein [Acidimicrobiales bacterium]
MSDHRFGDALGDLAGGRTDASTLARVSRLAAASAREAGGAAVASGRWAADQLLEIAPRIPVRDRQTLEAQHGGRTGTALADVLVRDATRVAAAIGGAAGALVSAEELAPPAWVAIPVELVVETLAVAAVELKLVAELHAAYDMAIEGPAGERAMTLVRSWADRRGVSVRHLARRGGVADALGRGTRNEVVRIVRRRLLRRLGRNLSSLMPMLIGAVAGAELNRRATRSLGEELQRDLERLRSRDA